ncbi:MAG: UDP-glucose 4-epimerase GalE [Aquirhabdus sp.]
MKSTILVTGGMGYIGSHTVVELVAAGYDLVILDNLINSSPKVLARLENICGRTIPFVNADARDRAALDRVFQEHQISSVIHFAGLKAVGESVAKPLEYFDNNINSTLTVLQAMRAANIKRFVFSSSATVYGNPHSVPIKENFPLQVTNPYGRTKLMCEEILRDLLTAEPDWHIATLRYFNPVGAHASGLIGEAPNGVPNNLMPYITQVAVGKREKLSIFGKDYPTPDGTGVRDYIHVVDLAAGHVAALRYIEDQKQSITANLGTGEGVSVRELVDTFQRATGIKIAHHYAERRPGDVESCYSDPSLAETFLGWRAKKDVIAMCTDSWHWQSMNPNGF